MLDSAGNDVVQPSQRWPALTRLHLLKNTPLRSPFLDKRMLTIPRPLVAAIFAFTQLSHPPCAGAQGAEADLAALSLSAGTLSPAFSGQTTHYSASVPHGTPSIILDAAAASETAQIRTRFNGGGSRSELPTTLDLRPGLNRVNLRVTAAGTPLTEFPLAAGSTRNLALHPEGRVVAWGVSADDTAGNPLPTSSQSDVTGVFSGLLGEYFLDTAGAVHRLSGATVPTELTPGVAGVSQPRVTALSLDRGVGVALRADGSVRTWGPHGNIASVLSAADVVAVAAGNLHCLTLDAHGRVRAHGNDNVAGQLNVPAAAQSGVVAIAAQSSRNLALRADGALVQWGQVSAEQATIPAEATNVVAIDLHLRTNFALTASGAVIAWGDSADQAPPPAAASGVVAIKTGPAHVLALRDDGSILAWGYRSGATTTPAVAPTGFDPLFTPPLRDYWVHIAREIPSPALASLESSGGPLSPDFAPATLTYTQTVPYGATNLSLSAVPVAADTASLRYRLNGAHAQPLTPATSLPLRRGFNQIRLQVTAAGSPLPDHPLAASSIRHLAVSSSGAIMHSRTGPSGTLPTLPPESQSNIVGVFAGVYGEYALTATGYLVRLSGAAVPDAAQPTSPTGGPAHAPGISLAIGQSHALLLRADGSTFAWGSNSSGQNTIPAAAQSDVVAVAAGSSHSIALRADGRVVAWGSTNQGATLVPPGLQSDIVAIAAYGTRNYALRADGLVISWGSALGTPPPVAAQSGIVAIAAGEAVAYALSNTGAVVAWNASTGASITPPDSLGSGIVAIAAGAYHLLALRSDGAVETWSPPSFVTPPLLADFPAPLVEAPVRTYHLLVERQDPAAAISALAPTLGAFDSPFAPETDAYSLAAATPYRGLALHALPFTQQPHLELRAGPGQPFRAVVAGRTLAYAQFGGVALRANGSVLGWGSSLSTVPPAAQSEVVSVAAGEAHALALKADGTVIAWGNNGALQTSLSPDLRGTAIAAGENFSVVLLPSGAPALFGAFGTGAVLTPHADAHDLVAIAAGSTHALGLRRDGRVVVWGGPSSVNTVPADAQSSVVAIAAAGGHCYALRADGRVVAWGAGSFGLTAVPSAVTYGVVSISASPVHAVALKADGAVIVWGSSVASFPAGFFTNPELAAVAAGGGSFNPITTLLFQDGSLLQVDFPPSSAPAELSTGTFARPLPGLLPLSLGANTVELRATSRTGPETRTYTINATRSSAPELALEFPPRPARISDGIPISLGFMKAGPPGTTFPVKIVNPGSADLTVSGASLSGPQAAEFVLSGLNFPFTLGPGEELAFSLTATPSVHGQRSASLVLQNNLPHGGPVSLPLRVEGLTVPGLLSGWRASRFTSAELADPALEATVWGDLADPDGDGIPNLLEYALNTAPKSPGQMPPVVLDTSDPAHPRLTITYTRLLRAQAAGLDYRVEWSDTLAPNSWTVEGVTEVVTPGAGASATTLETVTASVPAEGPRRFLRLRVTAP